MVVAHTFNPSTWEQRQVDLYEFEDNLVYKASSRTGSKATDRNSISGKKKKV